MCCGSKRSALSSASASRPPPRAARRRLAPRPRQRRSRLRRSRPRRRSTPGSPPPSRQATPLASRLSSRAHRAAGCPQVAVVQLAAMKIFGTFPHCPTISGFSSSAPRPNHPSVVAEHSKKKKKKKIFVAEHLSHSWLELTLRAARATLMSLKGRPERG